jgi:carbon storage regulator
MLVLNRMVGERIIIDGNIVVQIIDRRGDKIRIGITAPPDVTVHREEVQLAIARQRDRRPLGPIASDQ